MTEVLSELNTRDWVALILLAAGAVLIVSFRSARRSLGPMLRLLLLSRITISIIGMLLYVSVLIFSLHLIGTWQWWMLKTTVTWLFGTGFALLFSVPRLLEEERPLRRILVQSIRFTVVVELVVSLAVYNLLIELIMLVLLTLVTTLSAFAADRYAKYKKLFDGFLVLLGAGLIFFAIVAIASNVKVFVTLKNIEDFLLPIVLTIAYLPFIYLVTLYANYDAVFGRVNLSTEKPRGRLRAKVALVTKFRLQAREAHAFGLYWARQVALAPNLNAARHVVDDFRESERQKERAMVDEQERLQRHAGVEGTDEEGRRLDRREFKATTGALHWLSTCQSGRHRNQGGQYQMGLLQLLSSDFTRRGLPDDHGVTMKVAKDGQSWYAWRRTVSGWCFAIGAAGPDSDGWEYDGPDPPQGFPGQHPGWGDGPFSFDVNPNW